jgi:class 3 adenylate cyclase
MADDIRAWLEGLGFAAYADAFEENRIGIEHLGELSEDDLRELGVTAMGDRKSLLRAIAGLQDDAAEAQAPTAAGPESRPAAAERRQLTVMFCDLVGSTALSQELDPEDLREVMTRYQDAVAAAVTRFGGHVGKYLGDGVLAYFGWPQAYEDQADRAIHAALAVAPDVGAINVAGQPLQTRVGIASGEVVIGDLSGETAQEAGAISGETPNLAARLQEIAAPGEVVIGGQTHQLIGAAFEITDLGAQTLKGFNEAEPTWRVEGELAADIDEDDAGTAGVGMVGRDSELIYLKERWGRASNSEGQAVAVSGEAGIGKSRLLRALIDDVGGEAVTSLRYQCSPLFSGTMLYPFVQRMQRVAGFAAGDSDDEKLDRLEALFGFDAAAAAAKLPLVATLLEIPFEQRYGALELSSQERKAPLIALLREQLLRLAAAGPVLLVFEDAHWADPTSIELLQQLVPAIEQAAVLIVISHRPDPQADWLEQANVSGLSLNRLGRGEAAALVRATYARLLNEEVIDEIVARADGVPLFLEELTLAHGESGGAGSDIPATLQALLASRLDRLGSAKNLAQIGAAIGREFSRRLLARISGLNWGELETSLRALVASGLASGYGDGDGAVYTFKHALIHDAAYDSMLRGRRRELHAAIAAGLRDDDPELVERQPELLAHHEAQAGHHEAAYELYSKAAARAGTASAFQEVEAQLRAALRMAEQLPEGLERDRLELQVLTSLGTNRICLRGFPDDETLAFLASARQLIPRVGTMEIEFDLTWAEWMSTQLRGTTTDACAIADQLVPLAGQLDTDGHLLQAHHSCWTSRFTHEELEAVLEHTQKGIDVYDITRHRHHAFVYGGHDPGVCSRAIGGMTRCILGYPDQAAEWAAEGLALAERLGHEYSYGLALSLGTTVVFLRRDYQAVADRCGEISRMFERGEFPFLRPFVYILEGWADAHLSGDVTALNTIQKGVDVLVETGQKQSFGWNSLAEAACWLDVPEEGLKATDNAFVDIERANEHLWEAETHRMKGENILRHAPAETAEAENCFRTAIEVAGRQKAKTFELRSATALARIYQSQQQGALARDTLAPVYEWFTEGLDTPDLTDAKAVLDTL